MKRITALHSIGVAILSGGAAFAAVSGFVSSASASGPAPAKAPAAVKAVAKPLSASEIEVQYNPMNPGQADFVVSEFKYALGDDADKNGACPNGMATTSFNLFRDSPEGRRKEGESEEDYNKRIRAVMFAARKGPDACMSPELVGPDPNYKTVGISNIPVPGIDLDGQRSTRKGKAAAGTCGHDDFLGANGEVGIDNQFYRAVGCTAGFQTTGTKNGFATEMLTGAWGIVITIKGLDNPVNDPEIEVGIHANADPIQLSPGRKPLSHITYTMDADKRFQAWTKGRIVNGVLTTDPVDVRFHHTVNAIALERPLDQARLRMTFNKDGSIEGILAGYANVDALYDFLVGMRSGKDDKGNPAPLRLRQGTAGGSSASGGFTCNGMYAAFKQLADGQRDPKTGQCSAISMQYVVKAIPAFVVDRSASGGKVASSRLK